jgi:hypothetical protein
MMYRSPVRRAAFIAVSLVVPVIANGARGFGIVYLGHILGSAQAAAADHVIYGWVFFSAVILLLIALGLPFRQDEMSTRPAGPAVRFGPGSGAARLVGVALAVAGVAALTPALAFGITRATVAQAVAPPDVDLGPDCLSIKGAEPAPPGARGLRLICGQYAMDLVWQAFSPRVTAAPVMAERRLLVQRAQTEGLQESWLTGAGEPAGAWRVMRSNDPAFIIAVSVWIDGRPVRPGLTMRARMAISSLLGGTHAPVVMTVTPVADWAALNPATRKPVDAGLTAFLLAHPELSSQIGERSALR